MVVSWPRLSNLHLVEFYCRITVATVNEYPGSERLTDLPPAPSATLLLFGVIASTSDGELSPFKSSPESVLTVASVAVAHLAPDKHAPASMAILSNSGAWPLFTARSTRPWSPCCAANVKLLGSAPTCVKLRDLSAQVFLIIVCTWPGGSVANSEKSAQCGKNKCQQYNSDTVLWPSCAARQKARGAVRTEPCHIGKEKANSLVPAQTYTHRPHTHEHLRRHRHTATYLW
eukprot:COSAG02_NODE_302_length_25234_cov_43.365307_6_plen_230_part_00